MPPSDTPPPPDLPPPDLPPDIAGRLRALHAYCERFQDEQLLELWIALCGRDVFTVPLEDAEADSGEIADPVRPGPVGGPQCSSGNDEAKDMASTGSGRAEDGAPSPPPARRTRHDGWTAARRETFLGTLAKTGCVRDACRVAGISSTSAYRHRGRDPAFARDWEAALKDGAKILEAAAFQRGVEGVDEPIVSGGRIIGTKKRYSDMMLKLLVERGDMRRKQRIGGQPGVLTWEEWRAGWRFDWQGTKYKEPSEEEARAQIAARLTEMHARLAEAGLCEPDPPEDAEKGEETGEDGDPDEKRPGA